MSQDVDRDDSYPPFHDQPAAVPQADDLRRPAPGSGLRLEEGDPRQGCRHVQGHPGCGVCVRLQEQLWRWQVDRLRAHLRHPGQRQEVRTQAPAGPPRTVREEEDDPQAAQGTQEPYEEGARYQEGQGRTGRQEVSALFFWGNVAAAWCGCRCGLLAPRGMATRGDAFLLVWELDYSIKRENTKTIKEQQQQFPLNKEKSTANSATASQRSFPARTSEE